MNEQMNFAWEQIQTKGDINRNEKGYKWQDPEIHTINTFRATETCQPQPHLSSTKALPSSPATALENFKAECSPKG